MTKIVVILNGCILQEIVVDKEKIRIGRHPKNDVVIDNRACEWGACINYMWPQRYRP